MSERLTELQRQRALIQGHLAWLDQEIAAAATGKSATPWSSPPPSAVVAPPATMSVAASQEADELIAKFAVDPKSAAQSARKGCFLIFGLALALLALGVFGLYLYSRSVHENAVSPEANATHSSPPNR